VALLATLRKPDGGYRFSANRIRDIVGGSDAAIKSQVAALRPKPPASPVVSHAERPANGW
jgi:hypothetical protein